MTISLTCACGARLEIDKAFAGKTIHCPDCQRPLSTPAPEQAGARTSGLALASVVLALVGAFTVLGTLLAVVVGVLALRDLARRPSEITGRRYAWAGITLGGVLTVLTLFVLTSGQLLGVNNLIGRAQWAGQLDYDGPEEVVRSGAGYAITRPSPRWGVRRSQGDKDDPHFWDDLVLVNVDEDAVLVCHAETGGEGSTLEECRKEVLRKFRESDWAGLFGGQPTPGRRGVVTEGAPKRFEGVGTDEIMETRVDKAMAGQDRRFLIRVIKAPEEKTVYTLIGGTRRSHFDRVEPEIRKAMESFRRVAAERPNN